MFKLAFVTLFSICLVCCSSVSIKGLNDAQKTTLELDFGIFPELGAGSSIDNYSFFSIDGYDREKGILTVTIITTISTNPVRRSSLSVELEKDIPHRHTNVTDKVKISSSSLCWTLDSRGHVIMYVIRHSS